MNNLIDPSILTMSSREIAELCGKRHDNTTQVIKSLIDGGVLKSTTLSQYQNEQNKQYYMEWLSNKRDSLVIVARLSPEFTAVIVDRWQELEASQATIKQLPDFNNPVAAARAWADAKESEIKALAYAESARPAVEFVGRYVESTGLMGFRQVCKLLGANEHAFRAFLIDRSIMYRLGGEWVPYATHIDTGRFVVKTGTADNDHAFNSAKFTAKGVEWISKLWRDHIQSMTTK